MDKVIAFVTNQYSSDRIIVSARELAEQSQTELVVVQILDSEYELNPEAVEYLFSSAKKNNATMRIMFTDDKIRAMQDIISLHDSKRIVTGMPSVNNSVLYSLWKTYTEKQFYTVDQNGNLVEVAASVHVLASS